MVMVLNHVGAGHARSLIQAGHYDDATPWQFDGADGDALLGPQGNNWAAYAQMFLGEDTGATAQTKARYGYPFGKDGKVYGQALRAIRSRASQQNLTEIFDMAGVLLDLAKPKDAGGKSIGAERRRAYSVLTIKSIDEDERIITGIATTPTTDRLDDIVVSEGAQFKLPIPLLWQHDSDCPVGFVIDAVVGTEGIRVTCQFAKTDLPKSLADSLDSAWAQVKLGLVRGLSIGFAPIKIEQIEGSWGVRFTEWEWLELSAVTIPANADASIQTIRSLDQKSREIRVARHSPVVVLESPGGAGNNPTKVRQATTSVALVNEGEMKTIAEQIAALTATRATKVGRMSEVMNASIEGSRSTDAAEQDEYDGLDAEVKALDNDLRRLEGLQRLTAATAKPVADVTENADPHRAASETRTAPAAVLVKQTDKLAPGIGFARLVKCIGMAKGSVSDAVNLAAARYPNDEGLNQVMKAAVAAGTTGGWISGLIPIESGLFADFVAFLRPQTILGKFGTGNIPALRNVPFRVPLVTQDGGGRGYWVGEGQPKPLTRFDFTRTTLTPLKVANIAVATMESLRDSSPNAEVLLRDSLADALRERMDRDFVDPNKAAVANVSPASITHGISAIASVGNSADEVREDIRNLFAGFIAASNPPTSGVFIMSNTTALSLSLMRNALGQAEFPGMTMMGGILEGLPVLASEYVTADSNGGLVLLVNATDIYFADDGEISIDVSREASLQMDDAPASGGADVGGAGTTLVSLWQTNSVGFLAERSLNWALRRASAVQLLHDVNWGQPSS